MLSIAASVLADPDAEVTLLYGNRTSGSVMFAEELGDLKNRYGPRFQLVHVLSREPRDVELFSGRLDADRLRRLLDLLVPVARLDHVWLCGPFAMIAEAREVLDELGVPRSGCTSSSSTSTSRRPSCTAPTPGPAGETSEVTVVLDGAARPPPLPRDRTVLDGAQASRADLPFACKGGVCGTCRAGSRPARWTCAATTRSSRRRSRPASCSPARATRSPTR